MTSTALGRKALPVAFLLALTLLSFWPSLRNGFVNFDDPDLILDNPSVREISWNQVGPLIESCRPLTTFSHAVEHHFFQWNPRPYHVTNLAFHLLNTLAVFWLILLLARGNTAVALMTALLFGVHPTRVESVAWISERKDVLYSLFYLGGLIAYVYSMRTGKAIYRLLVLACFTLSLLAKPMAVTFPLMLLVLDGFEGHKISGAIFRNKIHLFLLAAFYAWLNFFLAHEIGAARDITTPHELMKAVRIVCYGPLFYVYKILWPLKLSCVYPYPDKLGALGRGLFFYSPLLLALAAAGSAWIARKRRYMMFGVLFFVVSLLPVLQAVRFGPAIVADRFTYLAAIGIFYIFSEAFYRLLHGSRIFLKRFLCGCLAAILVFLTVSTWNYCLSWRDSVTLWSHVIQNYPMVPMAYNSRGNAYTETGEYAKALEDYNHALSIKKDYSDAYCDRGHLYALEQRLSWAIADYRRALKYNPSHAFAQKNLDAIMTRMLRHVQDYSRAIKALPEKPDNYFLRANLLADLEMYPRALEDYDAVLALNPQFPRIYSNRASVYLAMKQWEKASADLEKALALEPNLAEAHYNRFFLFQKMGKKEEAEKAYQAYLKYSQA